MILNNTYSTTIINMNHSVHKVIPIVQHLILNPDTCPQQLAATTYSASVVDVAITVRPIVCQFFWHKLGDDKSTSIWFDRWCSLSPLRNTLSPRDITRSGCSLLTNVANLLRDGVWNWPSKWADQFSGIVSIATPHITPHVPNVICWKDNSGMMRPFSAGLVWNTIRDATGEVDLAKVVWFSHCIPRHAFHLWLTVKRKLKTHDMLRHWDVGPNHVKELASMAHLSHVFEDILNWLIPLSKSGSVKGVLPKLVLAATSYFIWQEQNLWLFQNKKRSADEVIDVIFATVVDFTSFGMSFSFSLGLSACSYESKCGFQPCFLSPAGKNGDLSAITSKGGPPDHMRASEKELAVLKSPLEQKSKFMRQERMLRRQEQQRLAKDAKIQRRI
nr:hypothetical protein [Tanacetum cinerariifolium]